MALPSAAEARPFYQAARQRLADARYLLDGNRRTGAVYLAGYSVECMLKALILSSVPGFDREEILASFKGSRAHDFNWLKGKYLEYAGMEVPREINRSLTLTKGWTTDLRYMASAFDDEDTGIFFTAVEDILAWADGRL